MDGLLERSTERYRSVLKMAQRLGRLYFFGDKFACWNQKTLMRSTMRTMFRKSLLNEKCEILNKSSEFRQEQVVNVGSISDEAEAMSQELSRNVSIHLHERERAQLILIERALAKIDEGTYGECESCGGEIGEARLKARPFAAFCIDCMEDREKSGPILN